MFFPNKSSRVQKKLGFWQKFACVSLAVEEQLKFGCVCLKEGLIFLSRLKCWRYGFLCSCCLETAAELAPCFWCCPTCQKLNFTHSFTSLQFLLTHTHTHWLQQLPNTKKLLKPRHHQFIYISTIILQGHGGHLFGTVLSEIQYFQGRILPTNDMTQWLFKHRFYCSVRSNVGTLLFLCLFFFLHGISM